MSATHWVTQDNAPKRGSFQPNVITNDCQVVITPSPWFYKSLFSAAVLPATALLETLETPKMDQFPRQNQNLSNRNQNLSDRRTCQRQHYSRHLKPKPKMDQFPKSFSLTEELASDSITRDTWTKTKNGSISKIILSDRRTWMLSFQWYSHILTFLRHGSLAS